MSINANEVMTKMLIAAKQVFAEKWPETQRYAESEITLFTDRFIDIEKLRMSGEITEERAKSHIEFQKQSWQTVLLAIQGMSLILVEEAISAALNAVKDIVNTAVGSIFQSKDEPEGGCI